MEIVYSQDISVNAGSVITLNGRTVETSISGKTLKIQLELSKNEIYSLHIPAGKIRGTAGGSAKELNLSFETEKGETVLPLEQMATLNPSPEAIKLYNFLIENHGRKVISGTMANVSWNTSEAEWVAKHTGKYPALNGFDYIHLYTSPASWINYEDTKVVEDWWNNNGLVTACWHWNVPISEGAINYAFYTSETTFDISESLREGTWQNKVIKADLEKIADNLLLLQQKNIPVLWRPLHEAAGGWFWWGAKGAEPCKALWELMFETFQAKGLNNLIWVWTAEPGDDNWYPGDEYVDIIGRDIYNKTQASQMETEYITLKQRYPHKIITLSECGSVAQITDQWSAGATWSWFMPWYDYGRTNDTGSTSFNETTHEHANIDFWKNAFNSSNVLSREDIPSLK